ncbi:hypothetical protein LSTR_LSTR007349 [Laodelphax striatellus]|uniref:Uncharacterized protein n=1 Tax=Laodelphax striatellus TaxID=195883 RepID=A0A482XNI6_LAOST|nr:hypothetical protein LSTR_LSTR007349 [Laodelphax striatellus]
MIAGSDSLSNVPAEATAFLGAVAAFVVLLLVFFLYLNKKWCFYGVSALNCCDEPFTTSRSKDLDRAYCYEEQETSSDSEEDVLRRLQRSASQQSQQSISAGHATATVRNGVQFFQSHQQQPHQHVEAGPSSSFSRNQFSPLLQTDVISGRPSKGADLMSLAEKGKMGVARTTSIGGVSSSASSSCSTTSAEDETAAAAASGSVIRHREITAAAGPLSPPAVVDVSGGGSSARRSFMAATAAGGSYQQQQLPLQQSSIEDENDEEATPLVPPPSHRGSTSNDCIVVMGQEPMFDVADLGTGPESAARCGAIEVAFAYDAPMRKMTVHVLQARHIPTKDRGGSIFF